MRAVEVGPALIEALIERVGPIDPGAFIRRGVIDALAELVVREDREALGEAALDSELESMEGRVAARLDDVRANPVPARKAALIGGRGGDARRINARDSTRGCSPGACLSSRHRNREPRSCRSIWRSIVRFHDCI